MDERVAVVTCDEYRDEKLTDALHKVVRLLDESGWKKFISPGQKVLLKPNFIRALPPERQAITHPLFILKCAEIVRSLGAHPLLGDSPAFGSLKRVLSMPGVKEFLSSGGIKVTGFRRKSREEFPLSRFSGVPVAQEINNVDLVINLPKLKAHCQLLFTGATKNMFGLVCGRWKAYYHLRASGDRQRFAMLLAEIAHRFPPALTIIDGVIGMDRTGPTNGVPYPFGVLIAGTNCFAIDLALAELFNIDWQDVPVLKAGYEAGFFNPDSVQLEIKGIAQEIRERFAQAQLPRELVPISFSVYRFVRGFLRHLREKFF